MKTLAVCSPSFCKNHKLRSLLELALNDAKIKFCGSQYELSESELVEFMKDAELAIVGKERIDAKFLEQVPKLKMISKYGVGLDNIDFLACEMHGVEVRHTPGVNKDAVAELAIGLMISLLRNISSSSALLTRGIWKKDGGTQLTGKTVGIIGCGAVGSELARRLLSFKCKILVCDIADKSKLCEELDARQTSFEEVLSLSDVLSLHVPLTPLTKKMINPESLLLMGANSILINTSRGEVVDEQALIEALSREKIGGAALDVYENEPQINPELMQAPNIIGTPHIAGNSIEAVLEMGKAAIAHASEFCRRELNK